MTDELAVLLRTRPLPHPPASLAADAIARARRSAVRRARQGSAIATALAVMVCAGIVRSVVLARLAAGGFAAWTSTTSTSTTSTSWAFIAAEVSVAALAVLCVRAMVDDHRELDCRATLIGVG